MISSQVLQNAIDELRSITRIDLCVFDPEGRTVVSTFNGDDISTDMVRLFNDSAADSQVIQGYHFFKIFDDQVVEYILVARGSSEDAYMIGKVAVSEIQNLIVAYKERFDRNNFFQNLLFIGKFQQVVGFIKFIVPGVQKVFFPLWFAVIAVGHHQIPVDVLFHHVLWGIE